MKTIKEKSDKQYHQMGLMCANTKDTYQDIPYSEYAVICSAEQNEKAEYRKWCENIGDER
jgi:hypothetical protein